MLLWPHEHFDCFFIGFFIKFLIGAAVSWHHWKSCHSLAGFDECFDENIYMDLILWLKFMEVLLLICLG